MNRVVVVVVVEQCAPTNCHTDERGDPDKEFESFNSLIHCEHKRIFRQFTWWSYYSFGAAEIQMAVELAILSDLRCWGESNC